MIAHVVELAGPGDAGGTAGVGRFRDRVVPAFQTQPGFQGCLILGSREQGRYLGVTLWDSDEDARLAEVRLEQERRTGQAPVNAQLAMAELYDVLAHQPPGRPCGCPSTTTSGE